MTMYVLDGRTMQDHYPGIGRYVFQLALALAGIAPGDRFRILYNPRARNSRFYLSQLTAFPNLELTPVEANAFSVAEQRIAFNRTLLKPAGLYHAPYYALPYALSIPLVVTLEDVIPLATAFEMHAGKRILYRLLNRLAAARAGQVITISEAAREDIVRLLHVPPDKIVVIPLAVSENLKPATQPEIEQLRRNLELPPEYLLYLGSNKPHKNLVRLINAYTRIRTNTALVIAGHWNTNFPQARNLVNRLRLKQNILFRHGVPETELAALLSGAHAFVFPSYYEGFGLGPLEAMVCGTPVACAAVSALPEVVGDAALLFDPFDETSIAEALAQLLDNDTLRAELRNKGFKQARQFSWERTARATLAVYQKNEHPAHL